MSLFSYLQMSAVKAIFQNIARNISKILPTMFQRYCLLLATLILRNTSYWKFLYKQQVISYPIVQLCPFKTNKKFD